jgi:hypothetical protein
MLANSVNTIKKLLSSLLKQSMMSNLIKSCQLMCTNTKTKIKITWAFTNLIFGKAANHAAIFS